VCPTLGSLVSRLVPFCLLYKYLLLTLIENHS
jgi:hypothetical protein